MQMRRRNFIKTMSCLTCTGALTAGCQNFSIFNSLQLDRGNDKYLKNFLKNIKNDKFYYKSKKDLPKVIRLEACSLCQLNCPVCGVRLFEKNAPKDWLGYLKFENFKKLVDDNKFNKIELSNNGEIFLNPELDKIIEYGYKKNVELCACNGVNLNTVNKKTLENLVKYKFSNLYISIDGATPKTYSIYRQGGDFNTVIENIKKINYFKKKYNSQFPILTWQFIPFGHNEHEIELAKKKALELNMKIKFKKNIVPDYSPVENTKMVMELTGMDLTKNSKHFFCKQIFNTPQIDYNGNLLGCCFIKIADFDKNVFEHGFLNSLNSPNYIYAKHMLTDLNTKSVNEIEGGGFLAALAWIISTLKKITAPFYNFITHRKFWLRQISWHNFRLKGAF